ncbi:GntR family transcriptional regulator [Mycobacterium sp. SMC-4]|uniref:GntR family transcriptional regulator n=1 Tax=Mycobacterium sp. SMC-4 TaxID=2857059 RepID=UPI0021B3ED23|nr:GntR family transcriptional regulator [Mycobacterium sp. SMC-4]UXA18203.1 GntR family transcriptional regulator [Mycobacterium sp. SMC-4]
MNRLPKAHVVRIGVDEILAGLDEGDPVPPERELALRFGVARETVRQALHELLVEGRIARRGRGTVVAQPKLVQRLSLQSYTEGAARQGHVPGRRLVGWEVVSATAELASALDVSPGADVMHLERVLLVDGQGIGLESTYLATSRFGYLLDTFDPTTSLYAAIRAGGVEFGHAVERIETVLASPREATLLESSTAMPMLLLNRRSFDTAGQPIETVRALYRGDRISFETVLS